MMAYAQLKHRKSPEAYIIGEFEKAFSTCIEENTKNHKLMEISESSVNYFKIIPLDFERSG